MVYLTKPKNFSPTFTVVSCVFIYKTETLLLQRRPDKSQGGKWGMPSGKVNENESINQAMIREILEETGLNADYSKLVHFRKFFVNSSGKEFNYHLYYLKFPNRPEIIMNPDEHTQFVWEELESIFSKDLVEDHPYCMRNFLKKFNYPATSLK